MLFLQNKHSKMKSPRNNYITIAKALGIIMMVIGHSGCPAILGNFIYFFHMPLFFVCSGYFFNEIIDSPSLRSFYLKRIKGLYLPYLKWSVFFLILHNLFINLYIIEGHYYQFYDFIRQFIKIVMMVDYELLVRPFWFIKELFLASFLVATISLGRRYLFPTIGNMHLLFFFLFASILSKLCPLVPLIGDCSVLLFSISYYYTGIIIYKYRDQIISLNSILLLFFVIITIACYIWNDTVDMRYTTIASHLPYYILSVMGIILVFNVSIKLNHNITDKSIIYYIGNHTMPILALNLLALKIGNLIKIWIYDLPIEKLASHTIIYEYNSIFWIIYSFIGISIPLYVYFVYYNLVVSEK